MTAGSRWSSLLTTSKASVDDAEEYGDGAEKLVKVGDTGEEDMGVRAQSVILARNKTRLDAISISDLQSFLQIITSQKGPKLLAGTNRAI